MHVFLFTFFFHCRSFSPWCGVAASISRFLTAAIKFSSFSSNEIGPRCFLFISLGSSFSVTQINVDVKI